MSWLIDEFKNKLNAATIKFVTFRDCNDAMIKRFAIKYLDISFEYIKGTHWPRLLLR
jgi:hypothetical protein